MPAAPVSAAPLPQKPSPDPYSFEALVRKERTWIDGQEPAAGCDARVSTTGLTGEPWIWFTPRDCFGIALSGGGIRSATFNLGLLQALEQKRLLARADYLSTVSGGGYLGGFLTAWRHRHGGLSFPTQTEPAGAAGPAAVAPEQSAGRTPAARNAQKPITPAAFKRPADTREPAPIRHLREFSRFLMPRSGLFHGETWGAFVTIVGGLLPSFAAACAIVMLMMALWLGVGWSLSASSPTVGALLMWFITLAAMACAEWRRRRTGKVDPVEAGLFKSCALVTTLWVAFLWLVVGTGGGSPGWLQSPIGTLREWFDVTPAITASGRKIQSIVGWLREHFNLWSTQWAVPGKDRSVMAGAFAPALAWLGVVMLLLLVRAYYSGLTGRRRPSATAQNQPAPSAGGVKDEPRPNWSGAIDRVITVCLGLAFAWAVLAALWCAGRLLIEKMGAKESTGALGAVGALMGGLFAWLRGWLSKPSEETRAATLLRKVAEHLRPKIPQVLALLAVLLLIVLINVVLLKLVQRDALFWPLMTGGAVILLTLIAFDPTRVGMHDFYRAKICRCFLGAARAEAADFSRVTTEQTGDDLLLDQLAGRVPPPGRPVHRTLHLVCCTANNLSGDVLGGLYRGGRSAVLSPHGIALGNHHARLETLRLSSALTASAAAFNSQMGRLSMDFGPAVAFLMSALNLRLGLWVPHPLNPNRGERFFRGLPFFLEMFGVTNSDIPECPTTAAPPSARPAKKRHPLRGRFRDLHLSDGGHFENLALYELVRRHCRYIIVSDCGADPEVVFDDLAIALRTIREDFGVEIDLDVSPLRPDANGRARQHAVVGTIHYDGLNGLDKGTLLYVKPALTGDEPPDVLQYQARNRAFPHESTGDQFYDEPQWESYRRLGQHAGNVVFRFLESYTEKRLQRPGFVENVFLDASRFWHPAPERQNEVFLALTDRCAALEKEIRENAPAFLCQEFFPEATVAANGSPAPRSSEQAPGVEDETNVLYFLMLVAQVMEDAWVGAELDTYWSHPLNDGWMNYFHRWASTPSFRRWWPVLRPIYSIGFRDFVRERFDLTYDSEETTGGARLTLRERYTGYGLAWDYWRQRRTRMPAPDERILEYWLTLNPAASAPDTNELLVGLLIFRANVKTLTVEWKSEDLFVPPSLNGAGITARFLSAVIDAFNKTVFRRLEVVFDARKSRPDPASRLQRLQEVNFYKSRGFVSEQPVARDQDLRLALPLPGGRMIGNVFKKTNDIGLMRPPVPQTQPAA